MWVMSHNLHQMGLIHPVMESIFRACTEVGVCGQVGGIWAQWGARQSRRRCMCCGAAMRHMTGCFPAALLWCTMAAQVDESPLDHP